MKELVTLIMETEMKMKTLNSSKCQKEIYKQYYTRRNIQSRFVHIILQLLMV